MTEIDETIINRVEIINHATTENGNGIGRLLTLYKELPICVYLFSLIIMVFGRVNNFLSCRLFTELPHFSHL
jgi:hypothetical protein